MPAIRVNDKTKKAIDTLAVRDGRSKAQIIEEALVAYYKAHPAKRKPKETRRGRPSCK